MARLDKSAARALAAQFSIPLESDFHGLASSHVDSVIAAADVRGYRKPANANGSRARYFHAFLQRTAGFHAVELDGMAAARRGDSAAANPYSAGMPGFALWLAGYRFASTPGEPPRIAAKGGIKARVARLVRRAIGRPLPAGGSTDCALNGDFCVRDGGGRILGRLAAGTWESELPELRPVERRAIPAGYSIERRPGGWAVYPPDSGSALPGLSGTYAAAVSRAQADSKDSGE